MAFNEPDQQRHAHVGYWSKSCFWHPNSSSTAFVAQVWYFHVDCSLHPEKAWLTKYSQSREQQTSKQTNKQASKQTNKQRATFFWRRAFDRALMGRFGGPFRRQLLPAIYMAKHILLYTFCLLLFLERVPESGCLRTFCPTPPIVLIVWFSHLSFTFNPARC